MKKPRLKPILLGVVVFVALFVLWALTADFENMSFNQRPQETRETLVEKTIKEHKISIGMTKAEVIQSWGKQESKLTSAMLGIESGREAGSEILFYAKNGDRWCLLFDSEGILKSMVVNDDYYKR